MARPCSVGSGWRPGTLAARAAPARPARPQPDGPSALHYQVVLHVGRALLTSVGAEVPGEAPMPEFVSAPPSSTKKISPPDEHRMSDLKDAYLKQMRAEAKRLEVRGGKVVHLPSPPPPPPPPPLAPPLPRGHRLELRAFKLDTSQQRKSPVSSFFTRGNRIELSAPPARHASASRGLVPHHGHDGRRRCAHPPPRSARRRGQPTARRIGTAP